MGYFVNLRVNYIYCYKSIKRPIKLLSFQTNKMIPDENTEDKTTKPREDNPQAGVNSCLQTNAVQDVMKPMETTSNGQRELGDLILDELANGKVKEDVDGNEEESHHDNENDEEVDLEDQTQSLTNGDLKRDGIPQWMWDEYEEDTRCGMRECQPECLQRLASKKVYILIYGLTGMFNYAIHSYSNATISTVEKRFKTSSRTSGLMISALDMGGLTFSMLLSYLGSRGHKTRWIASGMILVSLSCFLRILPHLLYGAGQDALELTREYGPQEYNFTHSTQETGDLICREEFIGEEEDCSAEGLSSLPPIILFISFFITGIGACMYYTLGLAYLDDNVRKNQSPFLLSVSQCIKMLGPTIGYLLGSYALKMYVDTSSHPTITNEDPRWIGAWWLGWGPLGVLSGVTGIGMALFPRKLPRAAYRAMKARAANEDVTVQTSSKPPTSFADFKQVVYRLTRNKVLVCNSMSSVLYLFAFIGYWIFMPKYLETQFRQSASKSSFITGTIGLFFSALGVMASGSIISKFKPRARYLAAWNVFVETLDILGFILYSFLNCSVDDLHGSPLPDGSWNLTAACNSGCDCGTMLKYSPVCSSDSSTTFYSACHAGCTTIEMINGTKTYGNCSCIGEDGGGWATEGQCPVDCTTKFTIYLVARCILTFFGSSGRAGNVIVQFRCVAEDDKSMSVGFTEVLICALALIPGPVVFGVLLDSACLVWGQTCGESGNCWLYNGQKLGYLVNFTATGCLIIGTMLDMGVWYYVKDLQIYDEKEEKKKKTEETSNGKQVKHEGEYQEVEETDEVSERTPPNST
ncbi:solute carrier organic anion transporter family member 74D-like isoform X2 [Periplaneta americana]|uniref:solute carrier organic anion transporter family member 74D-like isoform X2 n=1 Tax=Periplaneta americana TaxID=6978 RepID=UPI0037E84B65